MFNFVEFNFDSDGDGIADSYAEELDMDGDGIVDAIGLDTDGDGIFDSIHMDMNGDGVMDAVIVDIDGDGVMDAVTVDSDGDGVFDEIYVDTNGDGEIDTDGIYNEYMDEYIIVDSYQDGGYDETIEEEVHLNYDLDGDGIADSYVEELDTDGDGVAETVAIDIDGDGVFDEMYADTNGDGEIDVYEIYNDYNQDGVADSVTVYTDSNYDGVFDEVTKAYDSDGDGQLDTISTYYDTDGDGIEDAVVEERYLDTDNDGVADTYIYGVDADADGTFENIEVYDYDIKTGEMELLNIYMQSVEEGDTHYIEPEQFDPDSADMDLVSGDPAESMEEWEYQGDTNRCALYSQKFVIEELTGEELDIEELADLAEENGWFSEEGGTPLIDMNKVLDYYGVENTMSYHNDIDDIKECLDSEGKVIVALDADEIWYGETDDLFSPASAPDHAVEVIGIDYSNPDEPMVILNDSGTPNGCGEMVPLDIFMDAWEDGDCQMIACQ